MDPSAFDALVRARRSNIQIDPTVEVPLDVVEQICATAQWAPNHKRTWPLRIAVVTDDARSRLGNAIADVMATQNEDANKIAKTRTKYTRAPVVIVVGARDGDSGQRSRENRYAVAAGIQNILLAAEANGLAMLWGSPATGANDTISEFCGFEHHTEILGLLYLGHPREHAKVVERPPLDIAWIDE